VVPWIKAFFPDLWVKEFFSCHLSRLKKELLPTDNFIKCSIKKGNRPIYWIVKGFIIARNPLVALEFHEKGVGRGRCSIVCGMPMIPVLPRRHKGFQGWRYFRSSDAPLDMTRSQMEKGKVPPDLLNELSDLGLL